MSTAFLVCIALNLSLSAPVVDDAAVLHPLDVQVAPWANVYVDGELALAHQTQATIHLTPGPHTVVLIHPMAKTATFVVDGETTRTLKTRMRPLPAFVVVRTNTDAAIVIEGEERGRTWTSEIEPLSVDVPAWRAFGTREIVITQPGYKPLVTTAALIAGETTILDVRLAPADDDVPTPSSRGRAKPMLDTSSLFDG